MSGPGNGFKAASERAGQVAKFVALGVVLFGTVIAVQTWVASTSASSVKEFIKAEGQLTRDSLRAERRAEAQVEAVQDSIVLVQLKQLGALVAEGAYTRREVDAMRQASYHRQDSLVNVAVARAMAEMAKRWRIR